MPMIIPFTAIGTMTFDFHAPPAPLALPGDEALLNEMASLTASFRTLRQNANILHSQWSDLQLDLISARKHFLTSLEKIEILVKHITWLLEHAPNRRQWRSRLKFWYRRTHSKSTIHIEKHQRVTLSTALHDSLKAFSQLSGVVCTLEKSAGDVEVRAAGCFSNLVRLKDQGNDLSRKVAMRGSEIESELQGVKQQLNRNAAAAGANLENRSSAEVGHRKAIRKHDRWRAAHNTTKFIPGVNLLTYPITRRCLNNAKANNYITSVKIEDYQQEGHQLEQQAQTLSAQGDRFTQQAKEISDLQINLNATVQEIQASQSDTKRIVTGVGAVINEAHGKLQSASTVNRTLSSSAFDDGFLVQSEHVLHCLDVLLDQKRLEETLWRYDAETECVVMRLREQHDGLGRSIDSRRMLNV
ncbi:hypothetical protein SBOR_7646 [Sclerotinia borealis F-4128]|uniref:Uncharacterized protein n=1 Tax=Sclerotinia borealis (strain F-4128) TaxID=1432307 RepID=W9CAV1_SCLBF|nr:hypothetical protein SBOR_7646 [Sclerotinia borealis F-4128]